MNHAEIHILLVIVWAQKIVPVVLVRMSLFVTQFIAKIKI
jgi:hypothetical protein